MNIAAQIYSALGALVGNRCWPEEASETAALPFIVFRQADVRKFDTVDLMAMVTVVESYTIDIWAETRAEATTLAAAAMTAMLALNPAPMANTFDGLGWDFDPETGLNAAILTYTILNEL